MGNGFPPSYPLYGPSLLSRRSFGAPAYGPPVPLNNWRPMLNPMMGPSRLPERAGMVTALPLQAPVQVPPANDDLQKKHPGLYARLATHQLIEGLKPNWADTGKTLAQVARQQPVKDSQLADLDDQMKRFGSLAIATLATVGLKQKILGIGEYVGFMSWFGAMAATPTVINNMVRLKTGVNLGQQYDSTYGERLNIFKDPNYLPLHILPADTMDKVAKRLNIAPGPNQRRETEEKMRQISVQTHTWWMLMAGPATPVISGLVADNLQGPVIRGYNWMAKGVDSFRAKQAMSHDKPEVFEKRLKAALNRLTGPLPESELTSWWKDFGEAISDKTGLRNALTRKQVMDEGDTLLSDKITRYFTNEAETQDAQHPKNRVEGLTKEKVDRTLSYLDREFKVLEKTDDQGVITREIGGKLGALRKKARDFLHTFEDHFETELKKTQDTNKQEALQKRLNLVRQHADQMEKNITNAGSTVEHYRAVLQEAQKTFEKRFTEKTLDGAAQKALSELRHGIRLNLTNSTLTDLINQKRDGNSQAAKALQRSAFSEMENALAGGQHQIANQLMGANPGSHLSRVLKDVKAHAMWRNRVVYGLGGTMLVASGLYSALMVGRDFKPPLQPQSGGPS
ncbi:hypothetical protein [Vampirovibrio sp.]|uniref:hypothetical protein n=1 Tax=Vampirovibrio sp. TaxID=2717857 RepID=UPI0035948847